MAAPSVPAKAALAVQGAWLITRSGPIRQARQELARASQFRTSAWRIVS
jgi:hypothetical protein